MTSSNLFRDLHEKRYSTKSFETGHSGYDRFLIEALGWAGSFARLEADGWHDRSVLERSLPFLVRIGEETAESLGQAMLINAYCIPVHGHEWKGRLSELTRMSTFRQLFYDFTRTIPHARIAAEDTEALLVGIPKALIRDQAEIFGELFFQSFPADAPPSVKDALGTFLDNFFEADVLRYPDARPVIARHERFLAYLGRDPLEHISI